MKVVLINAPFLKEYMRYPGSPLGIAYLASSIRSRHQVKIFDLNVEPHPLPRLIKKIKEFNPDIIGMSSTTPTFSYLLNLARAIKEELCVPVLFGGNHVTALPEQSLSLPGIDFVIVKEGDLSFPRFLDEYEPERENYETPGLGYKTRDGAIHLNPPGPPIEPLDDLPYGAWDLLPLHKYRTRLRRFVNFMFTRGCPYSCIYCASHLTHGKKIRKRSLDHIMGELHILEKDFGVQFLAVWDDVLTLDREYIADFCERKLKEGLAMEFWGNTRVDMVDLELLKLMKRAGCSLLTYGIETGNSSTLELINKGTSLEQARRAVAWTKEAGIIPHGFLMINFANETELEMQNTIDFAFELDLPFFDLWSAIPYPSTKYELICREAGILPDQPPNDFSNYWFVEDVIENGIVPRQRVREIMARARRRMVMRPLFFRAFTEYMLKGARPTPDDLIYYGSLVPRVVQEIIMGGRN